MLPIPLYNTTTTEALSTYTETPLFNTEECDRILEEHLVEEPVTAKIDGDLVDRRRETLIHPIPYSEKSEELYRTIIDRVARANHSVYDFNITGIYGDLQLLEYPVGGHYDWHMDIGGGVAAHRKLSVIIQLSDPEDYEGGEVVFKASEVERQLTKERGHIGIFPSYVLHKVNPITEGKRYALVAWVMDRSRFK